MARTLYRFDDTTQVALFSDLLGDFLRLLLRQGPGARVPSNLVDVLLLLTLAHRRMAASEAGQGGNQRVQRWAAALRRGQGREEEVTGDEVVAATMALWRLPQAEVGELVVLVEKRLARLEKKRAGAAYVEL